jgi:hypothetical protein
MFKWLLDNSLGQPPAGHHRQPGADGLWGIHALAHAGGCVSGPQQTDGHHHDRIRRHGRRGSGATDHLPAGNDHERSARCGKRAVGLQRRPLFHLCDLQLENGDFPGQADGVGTSFLDGGRAASRRHAAHGADQFDHGRNHADRHSHRHGEDFADAGARIRRLGAASASDGDRRRRAGHSHRRRGAAVPGAAEHDPDGGTGHLARAVDRGAQGLLGQHLRRLP